MVVVDKAGESGIIDEERPGKKLCDPGHTRQSGGWIVFELLDQGWKAVSDYRCDGFSALWILFGTANGGDPAFEGATSVGELWWPRHKQYRRRGKNWEQSEQEEACVPLHDCEFSR